MTVEVPDDLTLDLRVLKIRELKLIASMTGKDFSALTQSLQEGAIDVSVAHALALVALRRTNPDATPEDAEEVNIMSLMDGVTAPEVEDPKGKAETS